MSEEDKNENTNYQAAEDSDPDLNDDDQIVGEFNKEDLKSRFYRNEWPEFNDLVAVSTQLYILLAWILVKIMALIKKHYLPIICYQNYFSEHHNFNFSLSF